MDPLLKWQLLGGAAMAGVAVFDRRVTRMGLYKSRSDADAIVTGLAVGAGMMALMVALLPTVIRLPFGDDS